MNILAKQCYQILQNIPRGKIITYKMIANHLKVKCYRTIGQIMKNNPYPIKWPCHRVIMSNGNLGGYRYGKEKKIYLLKQEGISIKGNIVIDYKNKIWHCIATEP